MVAQALPLLAGTLAPQEPLEGNKACILVVILQIATVVALVIGKQRGSVCVIVHMASSWKACRRRRA